LLTCSHPRPFCARYSPIASIHPVTTASRPCCELVGRWRSFVEIVRPSPHTPPTFDIVAPQSVPMNTCLLSSIAGAYRSRGTMDAIHMWKSVVFLAALAAIPLAPSRAAAFGTPRQGFGIGLGMGTGVTGVSGKLMAGPGAFQAVAGVWGNGNGEGRYLH